MTQEIRFIDPQELLDANMDYLERIELEGLQATYVAKLDTLFVEFGGPKEALSEHLVDNIMLRVEPDTLQIVGVEILDFLSDFLPHNRLFEEMASELELQEGMDSQIALMEPRFRPIRDVLQALIPHSPQSVVG